MPIVQKKTTSTKPQIIHLEESDPRYMDGEQRDPRLNLDPRVKAHTITIVPTDELKPNPHNPRKHPETQLALLAANMDRFGVWLPLVVDEANVIQVGHARWLAAQRINLRHLPVVRQDQLNEAEKRAWVIAENKLSELGQWDDDVLAGTFKFLDNIELGFDLNLTGFETVEIDRILETDSQSGNDDPADRLPAVRPEAVAVTARGDVWECGEHLLLCGDALSEADYATLMRGDRAQIVFTDPPYNVPNAGHVTKRADVREFEMAGGEMSPGEFTDFLRQASSNIRRVIDDGAVVYMCMDWRHNIELQTAAGEAFGPLKNLITWVKPNAGMGSFYRSQHELIFVYRAPGKHVNNFGLGGKGRHRSNVWQYPGLTSFGRDRDETLALHPTVKPVAMVKDALKDCSHRGQIVLDPFGGSGTTMIAAEQTRRRARLIEMDPLYCDTIVERWQSLTGKQALLAGTGESFAEAKARKTNAQTTGG